MIRLFDSHCHINDKDIDAKAAVEAARNAGVDFLLVIGWNLESSKKAVELAQEYPEVYAAVGIHPENYDEETFDSLKEIELLAKHPKVVAIGEIGLDYHWKNDDETKENQKIWFIKQIDLANKLGLPVSIHGRDASEDLYNILKEHQIVNGFVLHCYSGSVEMMKKFDTLGAYYGFDGPITYKNAITPKECVKQCLIDHVLIETDSPYLSPVPYRGQQNEPKNVDEVFKTVADLKATNPDELALQLNKNLESLFKVKRQ